MSKITLNLERFDHARAQELIDWLAPQVDAKKLFFGGSYIRNAQTVGDIDLAILRGADTDASLSQLMFSHGVRTLSSGKSLARVILEKDSFQFQLDMWFINDPAQWGPLCMFVAGNGQLNIRQRVQASKVGCSLSQYTVMKGGIDQGPFYTEQSVYQYFGWPWIPYDKRSV